MQPQPTYGATPPAAGAPRSGGLAQILSIVAVLLAVVALVVSFAIPGPTGATGATGPAGADGTNGTQGPAGPAGPGSLMAVNGSSATFIAIASTCTNSGLSINITVPRAGDIVVQGDTRLRISHTAGTEDRWLVAIAETSADCPSQAGTWLDSIGTNEPTQASYWKSAYTEANFTVTAAGTYTYYLNGYMVTGADANDVFIYAYMVAVFYPS